jgi:predicted phosphodiesterase
MRIAVLADTHAPGRWKACPPAVAGHLAGVDLILHAGDVCTACVCSTRARPPTGGASRTAPWACCGSTAAG